MRVLITGGTGFIGSVLARHLQQAGHQVRLLLRPSTTSPRLPRGVATEVAISTLGDARSLRAALTGIEAVYHLAGVENRGAYASLQEIDISGSKAIAEACSTSGIKRLFYLSHLGADRASAYPVMKAKAIAEAYIRNSTTPATIIRSGVVFGENDTFSHGLAWMAYALPFFFLTPGDGRSLLQPLWVEDLAACLTWLLDEPQTANQTYEIGGSEYFSFEQAVGMVLETLNIRRRMIYVAPPYLKALVVLLERWFPTSPVSVYWLDYLSANHTCALDTLPRLFHLMPARFSPPQLGYLKKVRWRRRVLYSLWQRKKF